MINKKFSIIDMYKFQDRKQKYDYWGVSLPEST